MTVISSTPDSLIPDIGEPEWNNHTLLKLKT
jgi:hypothetical protein